jgi:gluconolactonase
VAKATIRRTAVPQPLPDPSGAATETPSPHLNRRTLLTAALGAAAVAAAPVGAQPPAQSVSPNATPRDWSGREPVRYPDPDLVALDARFQKYILFNTAIVRLYTGSLWAEGPAWNAVGRYVVWSDIPNNRQLRFIEDDARVTTFRQPSGNSNGNTFDFEGRQLSCEHGGRRVARYEHDGRVTALAERYNGKRLNSPNDIAAHPDGSVWFTDPTYGIRGDYEGERAEPELKPAVYRVDPSGRIALVTDEVDQPNGICFSPDYKKVYVADTGAPSETKVWVAGTQLRSGKTFVKLDIPGTGQASAADGIRCDVDGNLWCGARPGVQIVAPNGERIGMIRLPEVCANICFGGARRNRLFMAASQSLYAVYVGVRGAGVA